MSGAKKDSRHSPFSLFMRLPRSGRSLGYRFIALLGLPLFLLITFFVHGATLFFAWAFYFLEVGANPNLGGFLDALFWSVTTVTTVGYGNIVPVTFYGKILGIVAMIFGSLCIVIYTAFFAGTLIAPEISVVEAKIRAMEEGVKDFERELKSDEAVQNELLRHLEVLIKKLK